MIVDRVYCTLASLLVVALLVACGGPRSRMVAEADVDGEVEQALEVIAALPEWNQTRSLDPSSRFGEAEVRSYVEAARLLSTFEPTNVREAYGLALDWARSEGDLSTVHAVEGDLYVLSRVLFAVPSRVAHEEARYFAVHHIALPPPPPKAYAEPLKPVVVDENGAISGILPARAGLALAGPYRALEEFDHFLEVYGFRGVIRYSRDEDSPSSEGS